MKKKEIEKQLDAYFSEVQAPDADQILAMARQKRAFSDEVMVQNDTAILKRKRLRVGAAVLLLLLIFTAVILPFVLTGPFGLYTSPNGDGMMHLPLKYDESDIQWQNGSQIKEYNLENDTNIRYFDTLTTYLTRHGSITKNDKQHLVVLREYYLNIDSTLLMPEEIELFAYLKYIPNRLKDFQKDLFVEYNGEKYYYTYDIIASRYNYRLLVPTETYTYYLTITTTLDESRMIYYLDMLFAD